MSAPGEFRSPIKILLPQIREGMGLDFRGMFLLRDSVQYVPDGFFFTLCAALVAFMWLN